MTPQEFKAKTQEILQNHTDQAKVSTILADLVADYDAEATTKATALTTAEKLTAEMETMRQANMKLFLQVGTTTPTATTTTTPVDNTLKYEDLFDEKGNLK